MSCCIFFCGARSEGTRATVWDRGPKVNPRTRGQGESPVLQDFPKLGVRTPGGSEKVRKNPKNLEKGVSGFPFIIWGG